jgi:NAD(P)-dependent dehydrogenase (short-subunit alcohol dehydrogenase family)
VALVTGASRRIGRHLAERLAAAGHRVAVHWRSDGEGAEATVAAIEAAGGTARAWQADLASTAACARLVRDIEAAWGPIDVLVNNASAFERADLDAMTVADLDRHHDANVRPTYALSLHAGRRMVERHAADPTYEGAILNLACASAERPWSRYIAYSASKAAVVSLTRGFARRLAPAARVNAIAPGPILPPAGGTPGQAAAAIRSTLLGRQGAPHDIGDAALFLLRARYVTGVVLAVDGGRSLEPPA